MRRSQLAIPIAALAAAAGACGEGDDAVDRAPAASRPAVQPWVPGDRSTAGRSAAPMPRSRALGTPTRGRLARGVRLPAEGPGFATWDPIFERRPNRGWRRWGTDRLVRVLEGVVDGYRAAHPTAPSVLVGDLSRRRGGDFGPRFGEVGHASHQNGLDVDVYYPRRDRRLRAPLRPAQVDRRLAQDLVDRFVAEGAELVFVGPRVGLRGPPRIVQRLALHDDHLHARLRSSGPRSRR